jgi:hypothetical protein
MNAIVPTPDGASTLAGKTILGEDPADILSIMEEAAEGFAGLHYLFGEIHEIAARTPEARAVEPVVWLLDIKKFAGMGKHLAFDLEQAVGRTADSMRDSHEGATQ